MYSLVSRISEGLRELKTVLEEHIHKQGVEVIAQCGDAAINVSLSRFQKQATNIRPICRMDAAFMPFYGYFFY